MPFHERFVHRLSEIAKSTLGVRSALLGLLAVAAYVAFHGFDLRRVDPAVLALLLGIWGALTTASLWRSAKLAAEVPRLRRALQDQRGAHLELEARLGEDLAEAGRRLREEQNRSRTAAKAKDAFLANISHELRTPLNAVIGLADVVSLHRLDKQQRSRMNELRRSAGILRHVVDQVLDFSSIEAEELQIEPTDCDLRQVIRGVLKRLGPRAEAKQLELTTAVDPDLPEHLKLDPLRIRQVLLHLVDNAVKFTEKGRVLVHVLGSETTPGKLELLVRVEDTGPGIAEEQLDYLFQPFHQLDNSLTRVRGGTGLGLAICRRLVDLMGGRMGGERLPGGGSVFWFSLTAPILGEGEYQGTPLDDTLDMERPRVLVVEDNPVNQEVTVTMLRSLGFQAEHAGDGAEALGRIEEERFHLVLMDCQMPRMDGYQATAEIRRREGDGRHVPIIAVTAHAMEGDRERCLAAGMDDYLPKPLDLDRLGDTLSRWIRM